MAEKKRILSGMRPTGKLHLGHLVGALSNWVKLQEDYDCLFMIADWHALMSEYENYRDLRDYVIDNVIDWLACGISPEKSIVFLQSNVQEHLDLYLLFSILTPLGWLERCPTYKEQLQNLRTRKIQTHAFIGYPVLQAADILIYEAELVPVGEDQLPHLELAREIVRRANNYFGLDLPEPQPLLTEVPRLPGLDGRKMSKSYGNVINLSAPPEEIKRKVAKMITDPARIRKTDPGHPEVCSVFMYHKAFSKSELDWIEQECRGGRIGCVECKKRLATTIINLLEPIQERRRGWEKDRGKVEDIIHEGSKRAKEIATRVWNKIRGKIWG